MTEELRMISDGPARRKATIKPRPIDVGHGTESKILC